MNNALYIAATGMQAQQLSIETTANNLANVSTVGYKAAHVAFQDLMRPQAPAGTTPAGFGVSGNVAILDFKDGELKPSDSSFDVAIRGNGFFEVRMPDGTTGYSRGGRLSIDKNAMLTLAGGFELARGLQVPPNTSELVIDAAGVVSARTADNAEAREIGQLELVGFANPLGLKQLGDGVYGATDASGEAMPGKPGHDGLGAIAQKFTEASNVKMLDEMTNLMLAQRAYQLNSKMIETADEIMAMTNNLRRGG